MSAHGGAGPVAAAQTLRLSNPLRTSGVVCRKVSEQSKEMINKKNIDSIGMLTLLCSDLFINMDHHHFINITTIFYDYDYYQ